jgi:hypothetical protein
MESNSICIASSEFLETPVMASIQTNGALHPSFSSYRPVSRLVRHFQRWSVAGERYPELPVLIFTKSDQVMVLQGIRKFFV